MVPVKPETSDIAVTVLGGYLGAGKTTLLNYLLQHADARMAVLVNDFGDINIDEALIESHDGDTLALANGCICCSLVDGFAAALDTVQAINPAPERLLIEASGVADPATVAAWAHAPGLRLDATVVVVDAETVKAKSQDRYVGDLVSDQIAAADLVVLNKIDLVDDVAAESLTAWLRDCSPAASVIPASHGQVSPAMLLGATDAQLARSLTPDNDGVQDAAVNADDVFATWEWTVSEPVTREAIEEFMDGLDDSVVRAKGFVDLVESPEHRTVLQRVGARWSLRAGRPWSTSDDRRSQIVFIGVKTDHG